MVPREPQRPPREVSASSSNTKRSLSYRSYSSDFEADDERSSSPDDAMGQERGFRDDPSQYAGEDTRLTSKKELAGWYAYGFAAEVFVVCGMGEFGISFFDASIWSRILGVVGIGPHEYSSTC